MPYKRRYRRRRTTGTSAYSCAKMAAPALASLARRIVPYLPFNAERHVATRADSTNPSSSGSVISDLCAIDQGDGFNNRTGNQVRMTSVYGWLDFTINASATNSQVRWILFLDRQPNGAAPSTTDVLLTASTISHLNDNNSGRFKVLRTGIVQLSADGREQGIRKFYVDLRGKLGNKRLMTRYSGTGGGVADIVTNNICLLLISNEVTNTPTVASNMRVRYIDN